MPIRIRRILATGCFLLAAMSAAAQPGTSVFYPSRFAVSPPVSSQPLVAQEYFTGIKVEHEIEKPAFESDAPFTGDPVIQTKILPLTSTGGANFDGVAANGVAPPDTNMAVGPTMIVQTVNAQYAVYDHHGTLKLGPNSLSSLWAPLGLSNGCATNNAGDVIAQYDRLADRWFIAQLGGLVPPYSQCIAVSKTSDPTGAYYLYYYDYGPTLNDYPKFGVWPTASNSAYLFTANIFENGAVFAAGQVCAFDRAKMLAGDPNAAQICQTINNDGNYLPSDLDGSTPPVNGSPGYFLTLETPTSLRVYAARPDFIANTLTLSPPQDIPVAAYQFACGDSACVPQLGTPFTLSVVSDRPMYRLAYRNFGDHETLVVNHSVSTATSAGVRWYELRSTPVSTNASFTVFQQGTFGPDANYRWMGSAAMDQFGDIAIGYSVSGSTVYPSIRYTGRLASDPLGTMQTEASIVEGSGYQGGGLARWGDYSAMRIDPTDDCTFWYTSEYEPSNSTILVPDSGTGSTQVIGANWATRIGSFRFSSCVSPPDFSISATPTTLSVNQGTTQTSVITLASVSGYSGSVDLSTSGCPPSATCTFDVSPDSLPSNGTTQSTLTVTAGSNTPLGFYTLNVTGTSGILNHTVAVSLAITIPDFSISASPRTATLTQGQSTYSVVTLNALNGFSGTVGLTVTGCPTSATCSIVPTSTLGPNSDTTPQLTLSTNANTAVGTFTVTVTGTAPGGLIHSTTVILTVLGVTSVNIISVSPEPSFAGQPYAIAYTVTAPSGTPTGNVSVTDGVAANTCTVAAGSCSLTSATAGAKTITVSYAGTGTFAPSQNATSHSVNKAATTTTITAITPEPSIANQPYAIVYTVTSQGGTPGGNVTVSDGTFTNTCSIAIGSCSLTSLTAGSKTVTATYFGDPNFAGSSGTAAHTVKPFSILLPSNVSVSPGQSTPFPVTVSAPAPASGLFVSLTSSDTSKVTITSANVLIPGGSTTAQATPKLNGINFGSAIITASAFGYPNVTQQVQVTTTAFFVPPAVMLNGAGLRSLTLYLSVPAPAGGLTFNLTSDNTSVATVPQTITIPGNAVSTTVLVSGVGSGTTLIHASALPNVPDTSATITVTAPLAISTTSLNSGLVGVAYSQTLQATGGSNPYTWTVVSGQLPAGLSLNSATGQITGTPSSAVTNSPLTFKATDSSSPAQTATANLSITIAPAGAPASIAATSGASQSTAINTAFAPLSATVKDSSNKPVSGVIVTFSVPSTGASGSFASNVNTAVTNASGIATAPTFTANSTAGSYQVTASVSGVAAPAIFALTNTPGPPASVTASSGGGQTTGVGMPFGAPLVATVRDSGGNPIGGVTVMFSTPASGPSAAIGASAITNSNGQATSSIPVANSSAGPYTIAASVAGIPAPAVFSMTNVGAPASIAAVSGSGQTTSINSPFASPLVVIVKDAASTPLPGITVTFTPPSSGPGGAFSGANTAVTNSQGQATSQPFTANGVAGTYAVTAAVSGVAATVMFQLTNVTGLVLPANVTVQLGQTAAFPISLSVSAPPGGIFVSLASSDPSKLTVSPANVLIPAGSNVPNGTPKVSGVSLGSATITASAYGFAPVSQQVQVNATASFYPATSSIPANTTRTVGLYLSVPAPAAGLTLTLSSDNPAVATVPPTVTFAAGATSAAVRVTGVAPGSTAIHANSLPNVPDTAAAITVN